MSIAAVVEPEKAACSSSSWRKISAWGVSIAVLVLLFVVWPYQHWTFEQRGSVLEGWVKLLSLHANAEWQFCYLVPFIVGWLVHQQRGALQALPLSGSWLGVPVLVLAVGLYWGGYKVDTGYLGFAAIQIMVAGLILIFCGIAWMRVLFFCWVFLAFAWPFMPMDYILAARLKIPTAMIAGNVMSLIGIDAAREGSVLQSVADFGAGIRQGEKFTLEVADSCSGMRSLYALIMTSVLYSFLALKRPWPRLLVAVSAIPLAVLANVVRLVLLAIGCMLFGQDFAVGKRAGDQQDESFYHLLAGYVSFGIALACMFGIAALLEGRRWKRIKLRIPAVSPAPSTSHGETSLLDHAARAVAVLVLGAAAVLWCWATPTTLTLAEPAFRMELPLTVGEYPSVEVGMMSKERALFDPGVSLVRRSYLTGSGGEIMSTLVMSGVVKKSLHTPEVCLPDQGWIISSSDVVPVTLADGRTIKATMMRIFRDMQIGPAQIVRIRALNLYWYQGSQGVGTPSYSMSNYISYRDSILRNLNHRWCQASFFMRMPDRRVGIGDPMEELAATQQLLGFVAKITPEFLKQP